MSLCAWAGTLCFLFLSAAASQEVITGNVVGIVTDSSGAIVPGANVIITELTTEQTRMATTDWNGRYAFKSIRPGEYRVSVTTRGFKTVDRHVSVSSGKDYDVRLKLEIGSVPETITVEAGGGGGHYPFTKLSMKGRSSQTIPL